MFCWMLLLKKPCKQAKKTPQLSLQHMSNPSTKIHVSASTVNLTASHQQLQSHQPQEILKNLVLLMTYFPFVCDLYVMWTSYDF